MDGRREMLSRKCTTAPPNHVLSRNFGVGTTTQLGGRVGQGTERLRHPPDGLMNNGVVKIWLKSTMDIKPFRCVATILDGLLAASFNVT